MKKILFSVAFLCFIAPTHAQCFDKVFAGGDHALGQKQDGTLWVWGVGGNGALGTGDYIDVYEPILLCSDTAYKAICMGDYGLNLIIKNNGTLWGGGGNSEGQLGLGNSINIEPNFVQIGTANNWKKISCRSNSTLAIKNDGSLWVWGYNGNYELGLGYAGGNVYAPTQVGTDTNWKEVYTQLRGSSTTHSMALKTNGTLWVWGNVASASTPHLANADTDWASISMGANHFLALKTNGTLWTAGSADYGDLGAPPGTLPFASLAAPRFLGSGWAKMCAGFHTSFAIKQDGTLWAWGKNGENVYQDGNYFAVGTSLGVGVPFGTYVYTPTQVGSDTNWKEVSVSEDFVLALKTDGSMWAWGKNWGGFGNGTANPEYWVVGQETPLYVAVSGCNLATQNTSKTPVVQIAPNPTSGFIKINYNSTTALKSIKVVDLLGKTVYQSNSMAIQNVQIQVPCSTWQKGVYLVEIVDEQNEVYNNKVVVE